MTKSILIVLSAAFLSLATGAVAQGLPAGTSSVPAEFSGGFETVPVDRGRPVILIASALGVTSEIFRDAFSKVHPAGPGSGGPTDGEARANKKVLMDALGKHGITDARLNEVSNFYRYPPGRGNLWKHQDATAEALIENGAIVGYKITNPGFGYTTAPKVTVPGHPEATADAKLAFGKDFQKNGSIAEIAPVKK